MEHPTSPLRERRRRQTARDIQQATLDLVGQHGYAHITTEMIAEAAGISLRTFFNYYPNKEAALVGPPARIDDRAIAQFALADGGLVEDFTRLILAQLDINISRKVSIRAIEDVIRMVPELEPAFSRSLATLRNQLATALEQRIGADSGICEILADVLTRIMSRTFRTWAHDDDMTAEAAVHEMANRLQAVGNALTGP